MKRILALALLLSLTLPALAIDDADVIYTGGTVSGLKEGTLGKFDTTQDLLLAFNHSGGKITIQRNSRPTPRRYRDHRSRDGQASSTPTPVPHFLPR
ncbi:MAG: hypothetical protein JWO13_1164 [Acidobacteriales bacterium]|nr:hypothetical protein [Terriglobales bacterium]